MILQFAYLTIRMVDDKPIVDVSANYLNNGENIVKDFTCEVYFVNNETDINIHINYVYLFSKLFSYEYLIDKILNINNYPMFVLPKGINIKDNSFYFEDINDFFVAYDIFNFLGYTLFENPDNLSEFIILYNDVDLSFNNDDFVDILKLYKEINKDSVVNFFNKQ